ncbi:hypothetical protein [Stieleria varia]|uniref:hypothetical protein n=1 Tax=Stieleria varia TaxID=2528005 RepID=UPI0011B84A0E|nr:hypothetical protein [Stieleria varia]
MADQHWLLNTRHLSYNACSADLESPSLDLRRMECGRSYRVEWEDFRARPYRPLIIYVHGNRMESEDLLSRAMSVHNSVRQFRNQQPIDWLIWSWPSEKDGILLEDAREKAKRTDAQALYLAWFLANQTDVGQPIGLIGYSFGCRIIGGALHALAGGNISGRTLPGEHRVGEHFQVGFVAPAMDARAMSACGVYRNACQNINELGLMYNRRDAVLRQFWKLDRDRSTMALGYSGPRSFAPRYDGSTLPVYARNCSQTIGLRHAELDYYEKQCYAGRDMSRLINQLSEFANATHSSQ